VHLFLIRAKADPWHVHSSARWQEGGAALTLFEREPMKVGKTITKMMVKVRPGDVPVFDTRNGVKNLAGGVRTLVLTRLWVPLSSARHRLRSMTRKRRNTPGYCDNPVVRFIGWLERDVLSTFLLKFDRILSHEGCAPDNRRRPLGRERNALRLFHKADFNMFVDLEAVPAGKCEAERDDQCRV
jgi:hypothetical protein